MAIVQVDRGLEFTAYLRGIETGSGADRNGPWRLFTAYLRGIETPFLVPTFSIPG